MVRRLFGTMRNPVAKNNKHRGGPFTHKDKEGRSYAKKKINKELEELDEKWIKEEIKDYEEQD